MAAPPRAEVGGGIAAEPASARRRPARLGCGRSWSPRCIPLGYVVVARGSPSAGSARLSSWSGPGSASCWSTPSRWWSSRCRVRGRRRRRAPGWWSGRTCRAGPLASVVRRAAGHSGVRQQLRLGRCDPVPRTGCAAGVLVTTLSYFPFMYLPVAATLRRLDPAVEESARASARIRLGVFFRVVLPQLRLAMLGGALLSALHLLAEFGAFAMLRFDDLHRRDLVRTRPRSTGPQPDALAVVLAASASWCWSLEAAAPGTARYARVGAGPPRRRARRPRSGRRAGRRRHSSRSWAPPGRAAGKRRALALRRRRAADWQPLLNAACRPSGWLCSAVPWRPSRRVPRRLARGPPPRPHGARPGGRQLRRQLPARRSSSRWHSSRSRSRRPRCTRRPLLVFAAYVILFLPRALVSVRAGIAQLPENARRGRAVARASPRSGDACGSPAPAAARPRRPVPRWSSLAAANELTATLLLAPTGTRTVATGFWSAASAIDYAAAAPYAVAGGAPVPPTVVHVRQSKVGGAMTVS